MKNVINKTIRTLLLTIISVIVVILSYIAYEFVKQHFWIKDKYETVKELSAKQKEKDFIFLTDLIKNVSPFTELNVKDKLLDNILIMEEEYIERAKETKTNLEFYALFKEYLNRINQTGHAYLLSYYENADNFNTFSFRSLYGIKKEAFSRVNYWNGIDYATQNYVYSDMKVGYREGYYYLLKDYEIEGEIIPKDTKLLNINGIPIDTYVKALQHKTMLRFDNVIKKLYTYDPFLIDPGKELSEWKVDFLLNEKRSKEYSIKKLAGYSLREYNSFNKTFCSELKEDTGYIRVFQFSNNEEKKDKELISDFMSKSKGNYKKLIIDIRGNTGGSPTYWMNNLLVPLLKEETYYERDAAVKKGFLDRLGLKYFIYKLQEGGLFEKTQNHFYKAEEVKSNKLSGEDWRYFKVTRRFEPQDTFPFDGEVYILTDNNNFSSAEDFVGAIKTLKLGKIVGANTLGGAASFIVPWLYSLPESGIMFRIETELTFNPEGKVDEIYGIRPDIELDTSAFPTECPDSDSKTSLLEDKWIQRILKD